MKNNFPHSGIDPRSCEFPEMRDSRLRGNAEPFGFLLNSAKERGFTLLEIMVSLVIICLVVVSVIQLSSANLRHLVSSDERIEMLERANEKMREVLNSDLSEEKTRQETDDDGYAYEIEIAERLNDRTENLAVKFMEITLSVRFAKGLKTKTVMLKTAKVVPRADALKSK